MKLTWLFLALVLASCTGKDSQNRMPDPSRDDAEIQETVRAFYAGLARAYTGESVDTDSLMDASFEKDVRYVTPWGWTEPLDTTKVRLRNAARHITNYIYRIENMQVQSFGTGAYAFFILRQSYDVDGSPLDEYLPTTLVFARSGQAWKIVHVHRSTDVQTIQQYVALQQKRMAGK